MGGVGLICTMTPQALAEKTWDLYQSHGVPIEVSEDILSQHGLEMDKDHLEGLIDQHQKKSQQASSGQFKSGLGGDTAKTRKLHSVTHILHAKLREMFGEDVKQMGSAITDEKARFDFSFSRALDEGELVELTNSIQSVIDKHLAMDKAEMSPDDARKLGAIGLFGEKYGDIVSVYTLSDTNGTVYSREFCGGPHITNTKEIGTFKVVKQKSVGQGVRRIEYDVV
jgi:alanyl-tRNA synthetase